MKNTDKDIQMLGPQVALEGSLVFEGTLFINGHVKGTLESGTGTIVIGESAVIHADVFVRNATVSGEVKGTVRATELIKLQPSARVNGALYAPRMQIEAGAMINGRCSTDEAPSGEKTVRNAPEETVDKQKNEIETEKK